MPHPLDSFFAPESIALLGASRDQEKIPGRLLSMLRKNEYPCKLYPINPNYGDIDGLKCYESIADVGRPIDLAFRTTRADLHTLCSPLIERTFAICEDALRLAEVRPSQLDGVILVGGQTRMPKVREMVSEYFGMEPQYTLDPDLAVEVFILEPLPPEEAESAEPQTR